MFNPITLLSRALSVLLTLVMATGCAAPQVWLPKTGQVLDWETKQPVAGAIVVARWEGLINILMVDAQSTCYHVESVQTDTEGRFRLPVYAEGINTAQHKSVSYRIYKVGYRESIDEQSRYRMYDKEGVYYLERDERQGKARLEYLTSMEQASRCADAGTSTKNLMPLYRMLYEEAKEVATTKQDQVIADGILSNLEAIELGYETAMQRAIERAEKRESPP